MKNFIAVFAAAAIGTAGAVTFGYPFKDGMVLQRDMPVHVWGRSDPRATVKVSFGGHETSAVAGTNGVWKTKLPAMTASKESRVLTAADSKNKVSVSDVLVGEVWFCAGQSNMEMALADDWVRYGDGTGRMVAQVTHRPYIRYMTGAKWSPLTPEFLTERRRSAIAVYYALDLYAELDVPIGLAVCAVGGSNIDSWNPANGEKANIYHPHVTSYGPFTLRGVLWYQGETNVKEGDLYRKKMHQLYDGWSAMLDCPGMSFYYVQLAPFDYGKGSEIFFPEFLEAQARFEKENPHAAMTVISDTISLHDIHPNNKWLVAKRLALHAFKRDYGFKDVEDSSPTLLSASAVSNTVELVFDHVKRFYIHHDGPDGYKTLDLPFEVAGADGVWKPARVLNAYSGRSWSQFGNVYSNTLIVASKEVKEPVQVRYAWTSPWQSWSYSQVELPLGSFKAEVKCPPPCKRPLGAAADQKPASARGLRLRLEDLALGADLVAVDQEQAPLAAVVLGGLQVRNAV